MLSCCLIKILILLSLLSLISKTNGNSSRISTEDSELSWRISSGEEVTIYSHPHTVLIHRKNCVDCVYEPSCGGSIYSEDTIITASECVLHKESKDLKVIAGSSYRTKPLHDGGVIFPVKEIYVHPNENVDLALLKLAVKISFQNKLSIKPISLANAMPKPGNLAVIVGWGQISENGAYSEHLREAYIPIVNSVECIQNDDEIYNEEYDICAGFSEGGVGACEGDIGSPLLVNGNLVGVTSRGYGCARPGKPGIYTNVFQLREWILSTALGIKIVFL